LNQFGNSATLELVASGVSPLTRDRLLQLWLKFLGRKNTG
jgi:hypothetical protein